VASIKGEVKYMHDIKTIVVSTWGEKIYSPSPERRHIFYELSVNGDYVDIENINRDFRDKLFDIIDETFDYLIGEDPWFYHKQCEYCHKRFEYVLSKIKSKEYVWKRTKCFRHYFLEHLDELIKVYITGGLGNREKFVAYNIPSKLITAKISTVDYDYNILINSTEAKVTVNYKGKHYMFRYNNHSNAFPFKSSYQYLIAIVNNFAGWILSNLVNSLIEAKKRNCHTGANLHVNTSMFPVCPPEQKEEEQ
jgi:hypothetical protein